MYYAFIATLLFAPVLGGVKLQVVDGRPLVGGVYVNGHGPYRFLVDTAATVNHIDPKLAAQIGLRATFQKALISSVGVRPAPGTDGVEIEVGGAWADQQEFLFAGLDVLRELSFQVQGILGQAFLSQFDYLLDLRGRRLEFGRQEIAGKRANFQMLQGRMGVLTSLGLMILDSGTRRIVLFWVHPGSEGKGLMKTLAGSEQVGMIDRQLTIGGQNVWSGQAIALPKRPEEGVAGLMPLSLFRTVYFCNSERYVIFQ
jgi:hypothetical protein